MSRWKAFTAGWEFRTATPGFESGQALEVYITGYDHERAVALVRIGDTVLEVSGPGPESVDETVAIRINSFDATTHRGKADILG